MKRLILLLALAFPLMAQAATLYYSRCDITSDVAADVISCIPGNDSNDGLSPTTPKLSAPTSFVTGNTYRFNKAGAWDQFPRTLINSRQDITFEDYTPASCIGACAERKPMIGATIKAGGCPDNIFWFAGSSARITVRNLHMVGKATDTTVNPTSAGGLNCSTHRAVYFYGDATNSNAGHRLENNVMERMFLAVQITATDAAAPTANRNIRITSNSIKHSVGQGIFGGADGLLIEGNTFDGNAWIHQMPAVATKDAHHLYLSSSGTAPAQWMVVRNNQLVNHNRKPGQTSSTCSTSIMIGHGNMPDLTIEGNSIEEESATGGCYALVIDGNTSSGDEAQKMDRLRMRGNFIRVPNAFVMLGCSACPDAIIENNKLVMESGTSSAQAIVINTISGSAAYQPARGDSAPGKATVRNNSVYMNTTSTARGACLAYRYAEYGTPVPSAEDVVVNNLCVYGPNMPASARAFGLEGAGPSRFAEFSNNVVYKAGGTPVWSDAHSTLASFTSAFGAKATGNSQANPDVTTPTLANGWAMTPNTGSFLIDGGHPSRSSNTGFDRYIITGTRRDIGAEEANSTTRAPWGPTGARIQ